LLNAVASPRYASEKRFPRECIEAVGMLVIRGAGTIDSLWFTESYARDYIPWLEGKDITDPQTRFKILRGALGETARNLGRLSEALREYMRACNDTRDLMRERAERLEKYKEELERLAKDLEQAHHERNIRILNPEGYTVRIDDALYEKFGFSVSTITNTLKDIGNLIPYLTE